MMQSRSPQQSDRAQALPQMQVAARLQAHRPLALVWEQALQTRLRESQRRLTLASTSPTAPPSQRRTKVCSWARRLFPRPAAAPQHALQPSSSSTARQELRYATYWP